MPWRTRRRATPCITPIDWAPIEKDLAGLGQKTVRVDSAAPDRDTYLRRPDLGRRLSAKSRERLAAAARPAPDLLIVVADGLSSTGVAANAVALIAALLPLARKSGWTLGPVVLGAARAASRSATMPARSSARAPSLVLIGERPGLSSPDSLGAYLTYAPRVGRKDGERNCVSNIRRGGLGADEAAFKIHWLLREAFRRSLTGVSAQGRKQLSARRRCRPPELSKPRPSENTKG